MGAPFQLNAQIKSAMECAILADDARTVRGLLRQNNALATARFEFSKLYRKGLLHWVYARDSWLHLAAAGHRCKVIQELLKAGLNVNAAMSRRRATPLHYAADGNVGASWFDPKNQVRTIQRLLEAGAELGKRDAQGATPLHRAVRTRCHRAVVILLEAGAKLDSRNKAGSTPFHLAVQNTGRGGTGKKEALDSQKRIIHEFLKRGAAISWKGPKGKTVLESATAGWVRELLTNA